MKKTFKQIKQEIIEEIKARIDDRAYKYGETYDEVVEALYKPAIGLEDEINELLQEALPGTTKTFESVLTYKQIDKLIYEKAAEFPKI